MFSHKLRGLDIKDGSLRGVQVLTEQGAEPDRPFIAANDSELQKHHLRVIIFCWTVGGACDRMGALICLSVISDGIIQGKQGDTI